MLWYMELRFDDPNDTELLDLIPILRSLATVRTFEPLALEPRYST